MHTSERINHTPSLYLLQAITEVYKEEGNSAYKEKEFHRAVDFYTQGLETKCKDDKLNAKLFCKRATAHLYMGRCLKMFSVTFFPLRDGIQLGEGTRRISEPKQQRRQPATKTSHLKILIRNWEMVTIVIIASSSHPLLLTEHATDGMVEAPLKLHRMRD